MQDGELLTIVESEINSALGFYTGELATERAEALDYYLGQPFGNEQEGRSQIVTRDVMDVIESIIPQLIRIFTSTDQAVQFDPVNEEDEEAAQQETDVINHVFYKKNKGFLLLYTAFKDALLQKNWFVRTFFDDSKIVTTEEYADLTEQQFNKLLEDPELEPEQHTEKTKEIEGIPVQLHDVVFKRTRIKGPTLMNIPPEEMLVSKRTNTPDIKQAPFLCHRRFVTQTELIEMGFDKKLVKGLPSNDDRIQTEESLSRQFLTDEFPDTAEHEDQSMREILVEDCYLYVDYDQDSVAELRHVMKVGNEILENEEVDSHGFSSATPNIIPHKFFGLSLADLVMDLQKINSALLRQILDNMYLTNNSRVAAQIGKVNLDDLTSSKPGLPVRTKEAPQNVLMPLKTPPLHHGGLDLLQYMESLREMRTGVGRTSQGLDANILKDANIPVAQNIYNAVYAKVELIARIFAEGVKQMFLDLHEIMRKHQDIPLTVKLRGKWVTINPTQWKERTDLTVSVGLGTGNRDGQIMQLKAIMQEQEKIFNHPALSPMVSPKEIYTAQKRSVEAMGYNVEDFFRDPETVPPPQPPPPDPSIELLNKQLEIEREKNQAKILTIQADHAMELAKLGAKQEKDLLDVETERTELELKYNQNVPGSTV